MIGASGCRMVGMVVGTCFIGPDLAVGPLGPLGVGAAVVVGVHVAPQGSVPGSRMNVSIREAVKKKYFFKHVCKYQPKRMRNDNKAMKPCGICFV